MRQTLVPAFADPQDFEPAGSAIGRAMHEIGESQVSAIEWRDTCIVAIAILIASWIRWE